ncbi:hypothetical protein [Lysobacter sp. Root667]|uniref:hypothetical protein n=1 Tax=Lysobacter sp. Root667 TaxID=1736581 RepID=UPI0012DEFB50|nr:hypothetical protein [Lysobacter sp. Root667]
MASSCFNAVGRAANIAMQHRQAKDATAIPVKNLIRSPALSQAALRCCFGWN